MKILKVVAKAAKKAEVLIYDIIGDGMFGGVSAKNFAKDLAELGKLDEINVRINSPGGNVFDAVAIHNTLRKNGARVLIDIDGLAASAATIVVMAGHEIRAANNSMLMIHEPWIMTMGSAHELRESADILDKIRGTILDTYVARTGAPEKKISDMMLAETWFTAAEAQELGFVDKVTEELKVAACISAEMASRFKHLPEALSPAAQFQATPNKKMELMRASLRARSL